jgi:hypothetical protein
MKRILKKGTAVISSILFLFYAVQLQAIDFVFYQEVQPWKFSQIPESEKFSFVVNLGFSALLYAGLIMSMISLILWLISKRKERYKKGIILGLAVMCVAVYIFVVGSLLTYFVMAHSAICIDVCHGPAPWYAKTLFLF